MDTVTSTWAPRFAAVSGRGDWETTVFFGSGFGTAGLEDEPVFAQLLPCVADLCAANVRNGDDGCGGRGGGGAAAEVVVPPRGGSAATFSRTAEPEGAAAPAFGC